MTVLDHSMVAGSAPSLLIGRERERVILRERLAAALAGNGGLALIGGEAGIGKTALAEAICRDATEHGALVLVGRCFDLAETPAYGPWLYLFERYHADGCPPLPPAFSEPGQVGAVPSQAALFRQVLDFLQAITAQRPVVLLLDDLHWADAASRDLLRFLSQSVGALPILIIVAYRSDELSRQHPLYHLLPILEREARAVRLDLRPLSPEAVHALVVRRYPLTDADADRLVSYLFERAEGNAFFTLQLLRALEEEDVLRRVESEWSVGELDRVRLPMAVLQVIDGRLLRLDEETQRLLAIAAVIGHEVPLPVWVVVSAVDEDRLAEALERAIAARAMEAMPDGTRLRFVHALMRQALYERILPPRRRRMHLAVAETLLASGIPDPDAVATHFRQAGDRRAIEWLIRAGERAEQAYAWFTAADRFGAALALMEEGGAAPQERGWLLFHLAMLTSYADHARTIAYLDEATRLAESASDRTLLTYATCRRGWVRCTAGDPRRGLPELERGVAALDALPAAEQVLIVTFGSVLRGHNDRAMLVVFLAQAGRYADAHLQAEQAIARGGELSRAHFGMGLVHAALGEAEGARRSFGIAREGLRALGHTHIEGWVAHYELARAVLAYQTDRLDERRRLADTSRQAWARAISIERNIIPDAALLALQYVETDWHEARAVAMTCRTAFGTTASAHIPKRVLGDIARAQGDMDRAWTVVREQLSEGVDTAYDDIDFIPALEFQRLAASLALDQGDLVTAYAWLETHDRWLASNGAVLGRSEGQALWVQYYRARGDARRAYHHATQALACAIEPRQPLALLAAHRLLGELNTLSGRIAYAATHLDAALGLATACAAPYERALTLLALAELRAATGQRAESAALLDEVRAICAPLSALPALARADALEARMKTDTGADRAAPPAGLTPREIEVLRLLAAGQTNRGIADALFLQRPDGAGPCPAYPHQDRGGEPRGGDRLRRAPRPRVISPSLLRAMYAFRRISRIWERDTNTRLHRWQGEWRSLCCLIRESREKRAPHQKETIMSAEENKACFRRFIEEGPNNGNFGVFDKLFDPSMANYLPGNAEPMRGVDGVKAVVTGFRTAFPDLRVTIEEVIAEGDTVAALVTARGTNTGELMGAAPSGRRAEWAVNHYCHFKEGKMVEDRVNFDQLGFLQQLGMMPGQE